MINSLVQIRVGLLTCLTTLMLMGVAASIKQESLCFAGDNGYKVVTGACDLQFPRDHGAHPGYQTEWWYYTGNVRSETGQRYGFQLTFFRRQFAPPGEENGWPRPASSWRTSQVYFAHAALSDMTAKRFYHDEKMARGAMGLAGVQRETEAITVFVGNWSTRITPAEHELEARSDGFSIKLRLKPVKKPILHGESGYSLKGSSPDKASCYYSLSRMEASGSLNVDGRDIPVIGNGWMDHEFSSAPLEPVHVGWDWFGLQLSDNTELMVYLLRRKDGSYGPASSGTFVQSSGKSNHLASEAFIVEPLDFWKSPHSDATYPSRWRLVVQPLQLELVISSNLADQEQRTQGSTQITYWEGSVSAEGAVAGRALSAVGYVELTGYAHPMEALR